MAAALDPTSDPTDPSAIIRKRALAQAGGAADPTVPAPAASAAPSTPSPSFTANASTTPPVTAPAAPGPATQNPTADQQMPGIPPGATLNPDGSVTLANGNVLPLPKGAFRDPTTGTIRYNPGVAAATGNTIPMQNGGTPSPGGGYESQNTVDVGTGQPFVSHNTAPDGGLNDPNMDSATRFQYYLSQHAGDPQAAIDAWNAAGAPGGLHAKWYPDTKTIGLDNGTYLVAPGAGGNPSKTNWQVVQRGTETAAGSVNGTDIPQKANPFLAQIRALLMQRLQADSTPVDPNDASIAQPLSAASDQASRSQDQERKVLAERLYAQGGGNVDQAQLSQGIQQSAEKNALGLGSLKAQLITQALTAKRQDLSDAMQLAIASGDSDSARNISLQIAALNAELTREGLGVNMAEFGQGQNDLTVSAAKNP